MAGNCTQPGTVTFPPVELSAFNNEQSVLKKFVFVGTKKCKTARRTKSTKFI